MAMGFGALCRIVALAGFGVAIAGASSASAEEAIALEESRLSRLEVRYAPSFSPWNELRYSWTSRGSWQMASVEAKWAPPWPAYTNSELRSADAWDELALRVELAEQGASNMDCAEWDAQELEMGQIALKVDRVGREGDWQRTCLLVEEDPATNQPHSSIRALLQLGASIEGFDRWTHPFWLRRESGLLRFDIQGLGYIDINDEPLGGVQGTTSVRVPIGEHRVRVRSASGDVSEETVRVTAEQTTILRLRINVDDVQQAQERSNP